MKFTPRQYQLEGRDFLKSRNFALLGDAPGVGKTGQAIISIDPKWRVLIVCPASVKTQWQEALMDWCGLESWVISSSTHSPPSSEKKKIVIVNYDLMIRNPLCWQLCKLRFDLIIYDEAHKLKSMSAKRTKVALGQQYLRPRAKRIWFLTGTPIKNRPVDLYPILRSCAPEVLGKHKSFLSFAYRYCGAYKSHFGLDTSGASNIDELRNSLKTFMLRREKRDVLNELPARIVIKQDLESTPAVKKIILDEEAQTIEAAGDEDPSLFKLGEIARIRRLLAKYKVPVCADYIKDILETEDKLVVFYHHKEVLHELRNTFKDVPSTFIDGSIDPSKRSGIVEKFRTDKTIKLFFGQMQACGEGIDGLQSVCSTCVFIEPSWSHTDIEQCIGRLERSGQQNNINVHILVIKDTIESRMMEVVREKLRVDEQLYKPENKEKPMSEEAALKRIADALEKIADHVCGNPVPTEKLPKAVIKSAVKTMEKAGAQAAEEVEPEVELDATEDSIRARAADVCALSPDGKAKEEVIAAIKKICKGKISDLKTPLQRLAAMRALDSLYILYSAPTEEEQDV